MEAVSEIVARGAAELGISLPEKACSAFTTYYETLESRRQSVNLTAITGAEAVARLHFLDSLALLKAGGFNGSRVIDVGSGAGFPGLPIKLAEPTVELTLLDATEKRINFLTELCGELDVRSVTCLHARAELAAHEPDMRSGFDIALSRAVARLNVLCELCLPFVRTGGRFLAMKGVDSAAELSEASRAIKTLGAELESGFTYTIPGTDIVHRAVVIRKISETPAEFPRRFAKLQKSPL